MLPKDKIPGKKPQWKSVGKQMRNGVITSKHNDYDNEERQTIKKTVRYFDDDKEMTII